jgi:serine-type D-Ala-D-Ala carboxypeptidase (penicillin-binding protein 5/6)
LALTRSLEPGTLSQRAMDAALEFGTGLVRKALDRAGKGSDKASDKGSDKGAAGAANPS